MKTIDPNRVPEILRACLHTDEEVPDGKVPSDAVIVDGVIHTFAFHPGRLEEHREEVREMLDLLPIEFRTTHEGGGGGWSFLNACAQRDPDRPGLSFEELPQWTGLHQTMDALLSLGQAFGYVKSQLPRSMWAMLPGGMPYYSISIGRRA